MGDERDAVASTYFCAAILCILKGGESDGLQMSTDSPPPPYFVYFSPVDSQFPIDISPVKRDHDFLDRDLVEPLCR